MVQLQAMLNQAKGVLNNAHAPYSGFHVACCILTTNCQFYVGCNVENASYGLTICAETNAIGQMVAAGEIAIAQILILVEHADICTPCGACRQRLIEFSNEKTLVHLATLPAGIQKTFTLEELLPHHFSAKNFAGCQPT